MQKQGPIPKDIESKIDTWLKPPFDNNTHLEIQHLLQHDQEKLIDAFYTNLSFGTAGLRGIMGAGTNRINIYTIRAATQGLCNYINSLDPAKPKSLVIGYDSRKNSRLFALETAKVAAGNHIHVFLSQDLRPTPYISFMCREKKASAAVMITASHNPPEYNGYKVFWSDGAQVVPPHDKNIIQQVQKITDISLVKLADESSKLITYLTKQDDETYLLKLQNLQNLSSLTQQKGATLSIIYSPLHGAGQTLLPQALKSWGFTNLHFVEQQKDPDPNFSYAKSPNPEEKKAMDLGMQMLQNTHSDLFVATDPDADRIGAAILNDHRPYLLTGNQIGVLCVYHLLSTYKKQNRLTPHHTVLSTIVSTRLLSKICADFHVKYIDTLTGFKYIGEKINLFEKKESSFNFLFGAEESYGFLYGHHARDKDGIITACLLAEIALTQKEKSKTLYHLLEEIYSLYGLHHEKLLSLTFEGVQGLKTIQQSIDHLRNHPPKDFLGLKVVQINDYLLSYSLDLKTHQKQSTALPQSNVLSFTLEDSTQLIIRPSGTEPKVKIYAMTSSDEKKPLPTLEAKLDHFLDKILEHIKDTYFSH